MLEDFAEAACGAELRVDRQWAFSIFCFAAVWLCTTISLWFSMIECESTSRFGRRVVQEPTIFIIICFAVNWNILQTYRKVRLLIWFWWARASILRAVFFFLVFVYLYLMCILLSALTVYFMSEGNADAMVFKYLSGLLESNNFKIYAELDWVSIISGLHKFRFQTLKTSFLYKTIRNK